MSGSDEILERQDFYEFQDQVSGSIPADFCHKNYDTGQALCGFNINPIFFWGGDNCCLHVFFLELTPIFLVLLCTDKISRKMT